MCRKINATGQITKDDIFQLYNIGKSIFHGCRVNSKDSPNCFCGLIPPPNGVRKQGLWQKVADTIVALGPDPNESLRSSLDFPSGLTNLGATCYANSILQCLYMNTSFRTCFFSAEPDLLQQQPVLYQLSRLFAQLHSGKRVAVDSAAFTRTLELDNGMQQGGHEFLTLLLSLLERFLGYLFCNLSRLNKVDIRIRGLIVSSIDSPILYFHKFELSLLSLFDVCMVVATKIQKISQSLGD